MTRLLIWAHTKAQTAAPLRDLFTSLNKTYCSSLGVEYMNIPNLEERKWVQTKIETMSLEKENSADYKKWLLQRLTAAEVFEKFTT